MTITVTSCMTIPITIDITIPISIDITIDITIPLTIDKFQIEVLGVTVKELPGHCYCLEHYKSTTQLIS